MGIATNNGRNGGEKNKKWIALAAAVVLAVTSLPVTAFAEKKDSTEIRCLQKSL